MILYDRKDNSIDIYTVYVNEEKIKEYKKRIISNLDIDELFYSLITNRSHTAYIVMSKSNRYQPYFYSNRFLSRGKSNYLFELVPMKINSHYDPKKQKDIIEKYIEGEYDNLNIKYIWKRISIVDCKYEEHRLLLTEKFMDIRTHFEKLGTPSFESKNVIKLPNELYLLYLLQHGDFYKIPSSNEKELFSLLEIEYLKSVSIMDIQNMLETDLIKGTLTDVMNEATIHSYILRKIKKV